MSESEPDVDYEVVIVAYRSRPLVETILTDLDARIPVVVVDNVHGADGLEEVVGRRPGARYLDGPGRGFAAGANVGARASTRPWVVFVNPDSVPTRAVLDELTGDLARDPTVAISCALQTDAHGRVDLGIGGWEPSVPRAVVHAVGLHKLLPDAGLWARPRPHRPIRVDWLGGAVFAVPRERFLALGGYDESYFVYSEDVEFGRTVRAAGMRLVLRTDLIVAHLVAGSGDSRTRMLRLRGQSMMRYLRRHHPRRRVEGVRAALVAGMAARWVVCRARGREGQAAEHASYVRGLLTSPAAAARFEAAAVAPH